MDERWQGEVEHLLAAIGANLDPTEMDAFRHALADLDRMRADVRDALRQLDAEAHCGGKNP
ncbi:hypothetical protein NKI31_12230 [Mesorhizobium sp. M0659]|uniref:hypothetical protein n=1 Tax=Mesorhizobium sp. M0659 TaxID=2956980 RepID=UPI00333C63B3